MSLSFVHESPATWDADKRRILGGAPGDLFDFSKYRDGDIIPGDWWRVEREGSVIGYGWMDATWGDAEVLLCVAPDAQGQGVGTFVMDRLEHEARSRGLNHLYNVIPRHHSDPAALKRWLEKRGFAPSEDGQVLQRVVRPGR